MRTATRVGLASTFVLGSGCAAASRSSEPSTGPTSAEGKWVFADPKGDDNGPGNYVYPTDKIYSPGCFDLTKFEVEPKGDTVEFRVDVSRRIEDGWDSKAWGGNGFSVQMAFIHIDVDHTAGSGVLDGLPGTNVRFQPEEAWDRVVIISPQGPTRVNAEVDAKAPQWKDKVIVPKITRSVGRTLIAVVDTADLGGPPQPGWGYQVLMQSNEGFPAKTDLLTRKVNEYEGQHRFGGGTDYDNDPHVIDMLAVPAQGTPIEVEAQHAALGAYNKETTEPKPEDLAIVPMVYLGR